MNEHDFARAVLNIQSNVSIVQRDRAGVATSSQSLPCGIGLLSPELSSIEPANKGASLWLMPLVQDGPVSRKFKRLIGFKMKTSSLKLMVALAVAACVAVSASVGAQETSKVVAKVNGYNITAKEIALAADDLRPQLEQVPANFRFAFIVEYLIERHLLAQEAVRSKTIETEEYKRRLKYYQAKALRDAYFTDNLATAVTEERVKAAYEKEAAKVTTEKRARARHILLNSEEEAQKALDRINKGEKFEEVAKQVSLDGSRDYGGDLGFFTAAEMVPAFSKAVFAMKKGEMSQPIKTDFGWHIIKLEDVQEGGAQPYEQVKTPIRLVLLRKAVQDKVLELRSAGKIEILDEDLKKLQDEAAKKRKQLEASGQVPKGASGGAVQVPQTTGGKSNKGDAQ
jgi:peptidyl-prolyl cis-trans isomerase C